MQDFNFTNILRNFPDFFSSHDNPPVILESKRNTCNVSFATAFSALFLQTKILGSDSTAKGAKIIQGRRGICLLNRARTVLFLSSTILVL